MDRLIMHPYPFQIYCYVAAFALTFRTNIAYMRFWDTRAPRCHHLCPRTFASGVVCEG